MFFLKSLYPSFSLALHIYIYFMQVMEADAVVLLGGGNADVPPTWFRPGAAVINCDSTLASGMVDYIVTVLTVTLWIWAVV